MKKKDGGSSSFDDLINELKSQKSGAQSASSSRKAAGGAEGFGDMDAILENPLGFLDELKTIGAEKVKDALHIVEEKVKADPLPYCGIAALGGVALGIWIASRVNHRAKEPKS